MAEINIERKKRSPLPWIVGVLALALIAFLLMRGRGDDAEPRDGTVVDTTTAATAAPTTQ